MNPLSPLPLRHELMRYQTIALLYQLATTAEELELPKPSAALAAARKQLEENRYHVAVMGGAKRGKTTLINALIGRAILPVEPEMAMRQGIQVSHAPEEAYRLRFEDGSQQDIPAADVRRYSVQEIASPGETLNPEQIIHSIEVEVPMPFLPRGISLWDTPDIEAAGTASAHLSQRFARRADVVIYLLDSHQPMGQPDVELIEAILESTPHIFFVQTQIGQYDPAHWEGVQQDNQNLLSSHFPDRLSAARIRPISGVKLLQAAQPEADEETRQSHQDFCDALQAFLFHAVGRRRIAEALMVATHDHALAHQTLTGRLAALTEVSQEELVALQHQAIERQQQFETEWGANGNKRQDLLASLQRVMTRGRQNFEAALQPGGEIDRAFQNQIQALKSVNDARQLSPKLHEEVITAVSNRWLQVCDFTQKECVTLMTPFFAEAVALPQAANQPNIEVGSEFDIEEAWTSRLLAGGREMTTLSGLASLPLTVLIGASVLTGPLGVLTLAATGLWGFVHGWTSSGQAQLDEARKKLSEYVSALLPEVRHYFFETELSAESHSVVDQYFEDLRQVTSERIDALVTQKSTEAQAEVERLLEQAPLDETQRQAHAQQMQQHVAAWNAIEASLQQILAALETTAS